jgi:hypothetical protein
MQESHTLYSTSDTSSPHSADSMRLSRVPGLLWIVLILALTVTACDDSSVGGMEDPEPQNREPTASFSVSPATDVTAGTEVTLDASASSDPDADALTFEWSLSGPDASTASLSSTSGQTSTFTADVGGDFDIELTIRDGNGGSDNAQEVLTATSSVIEISSDITTDETWAPPNIYRVTTNVGINGATLTIEPGTRVEFESDASLGVGDDPASLIAEGTAELPITLTGVTQTPGTWAGLWLSGEARLDHVTIEYAGGRDLTNSNYDDPANLVVTSGTLAMSNSTVREGAGYGIFASDGSTITTFDNNSVTANALGAVSTDAPAAASFDGDNSYVGNTVDKIFVNPRYGNIVGDASWSATDVPFVVTKELSTPSLFVGDGARLELEPGVTVEFENDVAFDVRGSVSALGTITSPVTLTSVDASADAAWGGLVLRGDASTAASFDYVTIEYAGSRDLTSSNYDDPANLVLRGGTLQMSNSTVRRGAGYGIFVQSASQVPAFDNNTVTANALGAISTDATPAYYFDTDNDYTGNAVDKIFVNPKYSDITGDVTWTANNVPFVVTDEPNDFQLLVGENNSLTLAPGANVEIEPNTVLTIGGGRLISEGTELQPISIRNVPGEPNFGGIVIDDGTGTFEHTIIRNGGSVELGYDDINANVVITSFTGFDDRISSATFGEGMVQSGAPFGLGFDNWGGSVGTTIASGIGCGAMELIYHPDPDDKEGQCRN